MGTSAYGLRIGGKSEGEEAPRKAPIRAGFMGTRREDHEGKEWAALLSIPFDDECECECHESGKPSEVCGECFRAGCLEG